MKKLLTLLGISLAIVPALALVNQARGGQQKGAFVDEKPVLEATLENEHFRVHFHEKDRGYAKVALRYSEEARASMKTFMGVELSGVTFFSTPIEMKWRKP